MRDHTGENGCVASSGLIAQATQLLEESREAGRLDGEEAASRWLGRAVDLLRLTAEATDYDAHINGMGCDRCGLEAAEGQGVYLGQIAPPVFIREYYPAGKDMWMCAPCGREVEKELHGE